MTVEIKSESLQPRRHTFSYTARRFGDRPASRYDEATYDVQPTENFHYRPLYEPEFEIYDARRTAIRMRDWYVFRDPRQFYYATYNMSRAALQQSAEAHFSFVEERDLLAALDPAWRQTVLGYLIPLRHFEWAANMNCQTIADRCYGAQIAAAAAFAGTDRLGLAQTLTRIGLLLDPTGSALEEGRRQWIEAPQWQELRRLLEETWVVRDWFELLVTQLLALDGLLVPLAFRHFEQAGLRRGAAAIAMVTALVNDIHADLARWTDAMVRAAAAESTENQVLISGWLATAEKRCLAALTPLAAGVLGAMDGRAALDAVAGGLDRRARELGLVREAVR